MISQTLVTFVSLMQNIYPYTCITTSKNFTMNKPFRLVNFDNVVIVDR